MLTEVKMTTSRKSKPFGYVALKNAAPFTIARSAAKLVRLKPAHRILPCSRGAYEAIRADFGEAIEIVDGKVCLARGER